MDDMTPERLDAMEQWLDIVQSEPLPRDAGLALIAALRQAWAERDAAAEEARALREAAEQVRPAKDGRCGYCQEYTDPRHDALLRVLATPPTVHAKLAAARKEWIDAWREVPHGVQAVGARERALVDAAHKRLDAADAALAEAEREAGARTDG